MRKPLRGKSKAVINDRTPKGQAAINAAKERADLAHVRGLLVDLGSQPSPIMVLVLMSG
jgi:hypothetical protein